MADCALAEERMTEARAAQAAANKLQKRAGELEREWRSMPDEDDVSALRRRARLRAESEAAQAQAAGLIRRMHELSQQAKTTEENHQALVVRCQRKTDELASISDRGRAEVETELADLFQQRYLYERDPKLLRRADALRQAVLEREGLTLIRETWVTTPQGEVVRESELGEYGGVGTTLIGKGSRIPIERARRLGIIAEK